jgi:hypothetical protein
MASLSRFKVCDAGSRFSVIPVPSLRTESGISPQAPAPAKRLRRRVGGVRRNDDGGPSGPALRAMATGNLIPTADVKRMWRPGTPL